MMPKRAPTKQTEHVTDVLAGALWIGAVIAMALLLLSQWSWFDWFHLW
jgi:hypothetical protein